MLLFGKLCRAATELFDSRMRLASHGLVTTGIEEGRAFQREGPMVAKDLVWAIAVLTRGTKRTCQYEERIG